MGCSPFRKKKSKEIDASTRLANNKQSSKKQVKSNGTDASMTLANNKQSSMKQVMMQDSAVRNPSPEKRQSSSEQARSPAPKPEIVNKQNTTYAARPHNPPIVANDPPPAREAAFAGPPRFDWIDIETAAATKIQSVWRKDKAMANMNKQGLSTSAIRNRRRRRKATQKNQRSRAAQSGDAPSLFQWCGAGLAFGDATEDDEDAYREFEKKRYEERHKQQAAHEEALRKKFLREKGDKGTVIEAVEVVE